MYEGGKGCWGKEAASSEEWGWVGGMWVRVGVGEPGKKRTSFNWVTGILKQEVFLLLSLFFALLTFLFQKKKNKNPMNIYST